MQSKHKDKFIKLNFNKGFHDPDYYDATLEDSNFYVTTVESNIENIFNILTGKIRTNIHNGISIDITPVDVDFNRIKDYEIVKFNLKEI